MVIHPFLVTSLIFPFASDSSMVLINGNFQVLLSGMVIRMSTAQPGKHSHKMNETPLAQSILSRAAKLSRLNTDTSAMQKIVTRDSRRVGHPVVKVVETDDVNDV